MNDPVVITGLGMVCALGSDRHTISTAARQGVRPFAPVRAFDASAFKVNLAAEAPVLDFVSRFGRAALRHTSYTDRLALWAADDALQQADLKASQQAEAGIFVGASTGGMREMEQVLARKDSPTLRAYWSYPVWATALALSRAFEIQGPRQTYMTACSSAAHSLGVAMQRLRAGSLNVALVGGVESVCQLTLAGFGSLGVLDPQGTRPFDAQRQGITLGEGAAFFVLERMSTAKKRGADILAVISGYGAAADAHHMVHPKDDGQGAWSAMRAAILDAKLTPDDIDYINAHGTGTKQNDAMELKAIARLLAERQRGGSRVALSSAKSMIGHTLGAAAALEAAITVLAMQQRFTPPNPGLTALTPELADMPDLLLVREALDKPPRVVLSTSFAFGGNNAALILQHPDTLEDEHHNASPPPPAEPVRVAIVGAAVSTAAGTAHNPASIDDLGGITASYADPQLASIDAQSPLPPGVTRRMDRLSLLNASLAALAKSSAGFGADDALAVHSGTTFGGLGLTHAFLERLFAKGPGLVNPLEFPNLVHNAPGGYTTIALGATGPSVTACQEEMAGDEAARLCVEQIEANLLQRAIAVGGDLHCPQLVDGYASVDRLFRTSSDLRSVVAAVAFEAVERAAARQVWAHVLGMGLSGPRGGIVEAVQQSLEQAQRHGAALRTVDLWYCGATERIGRDHEDQVKEQIERFEDVPRIEIRTVIGGAPGAGVAGVALAAAAIVVGRARTVLVTSITRDGCAQAFLLGGP